MKTRKSRRCCAAVVFVAIIVFAALASDDNLSHAQETGPHEGNYDDFTEQENSVHDQHIGHGGQLNEHDGEAVDDNPSLAQENLDASPGTSQHPMEEQHIYHEDLNDINRRESSAPSLTPDYVRDETAGNADSDERQQWAEGNPSEYQQPSEDGGVGSRSDTMENNEVNGREDVKVHSDTENTQKEQRSESEDCGEKSNGEESAADSQEAEKSINLEESKHETTLGAATHSEEFTTGESDSRQDTREDQSQPQEHPGEYTSYAREAESNEADLDDGVGEEDSDDLAYGTLSDDPGESESTTDSRGDQRSSSDGTGKSQETVAGEDKGETEQIPKVQGDEPNQSEDKKPKKEGSLASFFEKVKENEKKRSGPSLTEALSGGQGQSKTTKTESTPPEAKQSAEDLELLEELSKKKVYTGTWGMLTRGRKYADLLILSLLFDKRLIDDAAQRYGRVFDPVNLVIPKILNPDGTLKSAPSSTADDSDVTENSDPLKPQSKQQNVNTDFVEGLDDIDKFFEGVDPPDELDVGAAGTSIQDVLMGQTTKIIIKRVKIGAQFVSKTFKIVKVRVTDYLKNEDSKLPKLNREKFATAGSWMKNQGQLLIDKVREVYDSFFEGDELEGEEFESLSDNLKKIKEMSESSG